MQFWLTQVNSVHVNPVDSNLVVTASNDWTVRLNDVRMVGPAAADSKGTHPRVMSLMHLPSL